MPRVQTKTKNRGGKAETYRCDRCSEPIKPGERYHEWAFRYGGKHRQHTTHGYPRQSQLTQSKMAEVYAAAEALDDFAAHATARTVEAFKQDCVSAIEDAQAQAQDVISEYEAAIDAMPASEAENQERIDAIEAWVDELDSAKSDIEDLPERGSHDDQADAFASMREALEEAAASLSV